MILERIKDKVQVNVPQHLVADYMGTGEWKIPDKIKKGENADKKARKNEKNNY